jgi:hypothetical protein
MARGQARIVREDRPRPDADGGIITARRCTFSRAASPVIHFEAPVRARRGLERQRRLCREERTLLPHAEVEDRVQVGAFLREDALRHAMPAPRRFS